MKKVLVVVDLQNDFIDGPLGNDQTKTVVKNVVEKINGFKGMVIATKDTHFDSYLSTQEGKKLPIIHCVGGTEGWELNEKVKKCLNEKDNVVFEWLKTTFGSISLPRAIQRVLGENINEECEIEICGICTGICVISNAMILKAHFPEAKIIVDASCCACVTPESHKTALEAMKMCQIDVIGENK